MSPLLSRVIASLFSIDSHEAASLFVNIGLDVVEAA